MLAAVGTASAQGTPKERYQFDSDLPPTEVPPSNLKVSTGGVNLAVLTAASKTPFRSESEGGTQTLYY